MSDFFRKLAEKAKEVAIKIEDDRSTAYEAGENLSSFELCRRFDNSFRGIEKWPVASGYADALKEQLYDMSESEIRSLGKKCVDNQYIRAANLIQRFLKENY